MIRGIALPVVGILVAAAVCLASPGDETSPASPDTSAAAGVVVVSVDPLGPAERAGIQRGDILLKVDKLGLQTAGDLQFYVSRVGVGQLVALELTRGGAAQTIVVEIGSRNDRPYIGVTVQGSPGLGRGRVEAPWIVPGSMPLRRALGNWTVRAQVTEVLPGSPAEQAGLREGDTIVAVDGERLTLDRTLDDLVDKHVPGDTAELEVRRDGGGTQRLSVRVGSAPDDASKPYLGVRYRSVPALLDTAMDTPGYLVLRVADDGPAAAAGVVMGDVIATIAGRAVDTSQALAEVVASHKPGDVLDLGLRGAGGDRTVRVTLGQRPDDATRAYLGVVAGAFMGPGSERFVPSQTPRPRLRSMPLGFARAMAI